MDNFQIKGNAQLEKNARYEQELFLCLPIPNQCPIKAY